MPFLFECPHCHARSEVDDAFAGQRGPCVACGHEIQLPQPISTAYTTASVLLQTKPRRFSARRFSFALIAAAMIILVVGGLWFVVTRIIVPNFGDNSPTAQLARSRRNLERIAQAMQAYEAEHGSLPPAYLLDDQGRPAHSWRVLLLPYLGQEKLYKQYRFDEPWNGPHNAELAGSMPNIYAAPTDPTAGGFSDTSYMVIVGPATAFPGDAGLPTSEIADGLATTLLVTEVEQSNVNWLEPTDLRQSQMELTINGGRGNGISSGYPGGACIVTANGETHFLRDENSPEVIEALITANGFESLQWSDVVTSPQP